MAPIYIESYGCALNFSEGEVMAGLLREAGHEITHSVKKADALIVNMCSVKTPTEHKILRRVRELHAENESRPIIVAGCIPVGGKKKIEAISKNISLVNTQNIQQIGSAVETALSGGRTVLLTKDKKKKLSLPKILRNPVVGIIPISSGCDLACTYCVTTILKGELWSYPAKDIRDEIVRHHTMGCREFWLTSQDNGAYYTDRVKRCMLPELLNGITELEGEFRVRVGMTNPVYVLDILDAFLDSFASEKIFKFLHVPVQSGNDRILGEMKREYTASDFKTLVKAFRKRYPESTLSTDVICGFPGETEEEFEETLELVREIKPEVLNISRFWLRDGTMAMHMPNQNHGSITKERSRKVTKLFVKISKESCEAWKGWEGIALVDEPGSKPGTVIARNNAYRPIVLKGNAKMLGKFVQVKITGAGPHYLFGELLK